MNVTRKYSQENFKSITNACSVKTTTLIREKLITTLFMQYANHLALTINDTSTVQKEQFAKEFATFCSNNENYLDASTYAKINQLCLNKLTVATRADYKLKNAFCKVLSNVQGFETYKPCLENEDTNFGEYEDTTADGSIDESVQLKSDTGYDIITGYYNEVKSMLHAQNDLWFTFFK